MPDDYYNVNEGALTFQADAGSKSTPPATFPFKAEEAYIVRLKAFANGAIYIQKIKHPDTNTGITAVKTLVERKIKEINALLETNPDIPGKVLFTELDRFNNELASASGLKRKDIALGEAFWAWQVYPRPETRTTTYTTGAIGSELTVIQKETLLHSSLTIAQKNDLMRIHETARKEQPEWFKKLPAWAQSNLKDIVPKEETGDWGAYQKTIPATLRHIPGQANATKHELTITDEKEGTIISATTAYRQAVPTAFEMPKQDHERSAEDNLKQMLDDIASEQNRKTAFCSYWGVAEENHGKPGGFNALAESAPVFLGGLLTPREQGGFISNVLDITGVSGKENNSLFAEHKTKALATLPETPHVFNLNVALNNQRSSTPIVVNQIYLDCVIKFEKALQAEEGIIIGDDDKLDKYQTKITQLTNAKNALIHHNLKSELPGRNKNLHTAALYELTTRLMGGCSTGNCKSSKDRKGVEFIMADAMMVYHAIYKKFPACDDKGDERKNFIRMFAEQYNSGHQLLVAQDNSPGSAGIKDEGILDRDIIEALGESYKQSKEIANFNKPKTFFDKHDKKIQQALLVLAFIATVATVLLLATGVLAPAALLTGAVAAQLGGGALIAGAVGAIGSFAAAGVAYLGVETFMNRNKTKNTFANLPRRTALETATRPTPTEPAHSDTQSSTNETNETNLLSESDVSTQDCNDSHPILGEAPQSPTKKTNSISLSKYSNLSRNDTEQPNSPSRSLEDPRPRRKSFSSFDRPLKGPPQTPEQGTEHQKKIKQEIQSLKKSENPREIDKERARINFPF